MTDDDKYMRRCLQLAMNGERHVSPNPMVGAVIVHNNKIIGEGYHRYWGGAHAEVNAVNSVADKSLLSSSTIYVSLEPCSHFGKTPPCAKLIIDSKIPRVVVGCLDPFKEVSGRGVKMLQDAGIDVKVGVLESECHELNRRFMIANEKRRPYVMLKWAQSADGYIDIIRGENTTPKVISTPITMTIMHGERAKFDAIMVGKGTVLADNPELTVRRWHGRNPLRVVAGNVDDKNYLIFNESAKTYKLQCTEHNPEKQLKELYDNGVRCVMIEGGAQLLQSYIDADMWDDIRVESSINMLSNGVKAPKIGQIANYSELYDGNTIYYWRNR